jgi:nucleotide-binding universal stress UspA family protein
LENVIKGKTKFTDHSLYPMSVVQKKVLCAIDFSNPSHQALKWAVDFSRSIGCNLAVLYSYRLTRRLNEDILALKKRIELEALDHFSQFESEYLSNANLTYEFKVEIGFIADRVEDFANKNSISFIVMDKTVYTRTRETFDELLELANVPIIIVP